MSKITVIVPVYKVEKYLRRCVDSILSQTFNDFDMVLIDDASPDHCGTICDEYASIDERVFVVHHTKNLGLSAARNSGLDWTMKHSNSQWITFIDSDDWVHPLYLEALFEAAKDHKISVCYRIKTHGEELPALSAYTITHLKPEDYYLTYMGNSTVAWAKLYAKELFQDIRYPVGKLHEDEFVTYKIIFQVDEIAFIPEELYAHYLNPNSIMHQPWSLQELDILEAYENQLSFFDEEFFPALAETVFKNLIRTNLSFQKMLRSSPTQIGIRKSFQKLQIQMIRIICKYWTRKWIYCWFFKKIIP